MEPLNAGEFLQGFLEESGEHIQSINRDLLRLEQITSQLEGFALDDAGRLAGEVEQEELLKSLFRSFHTLKGLAGMIGLSEAAQLSHAMEAALNKMQQSMAAERLPVDPVLIDHLFGGTRTLVATIDTLRSPGLPMPDIQPDVRLLEAWLHPGEEAVSAVDEQHHAGAPSAADAAETPAGKGGVLDVLPELSPYPEVVQSLGETEQRKVGAAAQAGQSFALIIFTSTAERAARGENVDRVRQQILEAGTLIKAVPVMAAGQMRFMFLAAAPQPWEAGQLLADEVIPLAAQVMPQVGPLPETARGHGKLMIEPHGGSRESGPASQPAVVRVDLERLDDLMRYAGDLLLLRSRLGNHLAGLEGPPTAARRGLKQTYDQLGRTLRDLRRAILRARMVPLAETLNHMPLVVRDLARSQQKEVRLVIQGDQTEVDKVLVERLLDPLIHLVRNAISHGIERPAERLAQGKPERGTLTLRAYPEGDHILIEVADDGQGVDLARVADRAAQLGLRPENGPVDADEALELITRPGFSTRAQADLGAGRGVGLDVVQRMVHSFGGQLSMETRPGQGTTFRLHLPLALVIADTVFVRCGSERYAVPRDSIAKIIEIDTDKIVMTEGGELLPNQEGYYVLYRLADLLDIPEGVDPPRRLFGLVGQVNTAGQGLKRTSSPLLVVDQVMNLSEVVVQTINDPLVAQPGIGGATQMGDGSVVLILDVPSLLRMATRRLYA